MTPPEPTADDNLLEHDEPAERMSPRRFGRKAALAGSGAALIAVVGVAVVTYADHSDDSATISPGCRIESAGALGLHDINAISPSGEYLLGEDVGEDLMVRKGSKPVRVRPVLADGFGVPEDAVRIHYGSPLAVNSSGAVIGSADLRLDTDSNRGGDTAWLYQDGEVTKLKPPAEYDGPEWYVELADLGDDGAVVGSVVKRPNHVEDGDVRAVPLKWSPDSHKPTILDKAGAVSGNTSGVNKDGVVVGTIYPSSTEGSDPVGSKKIVSWGPDGERTELPFGVDALDGVVDVFPEVAGDWVLVGEYRWNLAGDDPPQRVLPSDDYSFDDDDNFDDYEELDDEKNLRTSPIPELSIDEHGRVYGVDGTRPVVESGGELHRLPVKPDRGFGEAGEYNASRPSAVSDDGGVILGKHDYYRDYDDVKTATFLWRCAA